MEKANKKNKLILKFKILKFKISFDTLNKKIYGFKSCFNKYLLNFKYLLILYVILYLFFSFIISAYAQNNRTKKFNTLNDIILFSLNNNKELKTFILDLNKAQIDLSLAKAKRFPKIDFNITLTYIGNPVGPITIPQGSLGSFPAGGGDILIPPADTQVYKGMENTLYQFTLKIDQPVFTWGKIENGIKIYEKAVELAKLKIKEKENEIKTKLSIYYYSIFYMEKIIRIIEQQKKYTERILKIVNDSYENGFITEAELLKTKISTKEIELAAINLQNQLKILKSSLKTELGISNEVNVSLLFKDINYNDDFQDKNGFQFEKIELNTLEDLKKIALKNNIQFKQLEFLKYINDLQIKINKASSYFKPDIGLRFELSYSGPRFPFIETGWFGNDDYNFTFSLAFVSLIFDQGQQKGKIEQSKQTLQKVLINFDLAKQMLFSEIEKNYYKINLNLSKIEYYKIKIANEGMNAKEKKIIFEGGSGSEIDYLKALIDLDKEKINLFKELINYYTNVFTLKAMVNTL